MKKALSRLIQRESSNGGAAAAGAGNWRKSSHSDTGRRHGGPACVEVTVTTDTSRWAHKADCDKLYLMRDSKKPDGPVLAFTPAEWDAFVLGVKDGEFDLP
jgi:Domain of unknown function (DUF397)